MVVTSLKAPNQLLSCWLPDPQKLPNQKLLS